MAKIEMIRARVEPRKKREMRDWAKEEGHKSLSSYMMSCVAYRQTSLPYLKELELIATQLNSLIDKMKKM